MQRWFNIHKSINVIQQRQKTLDHLNTCTKSLQQNPTPHHDKSSKKTRNRRKVPQHCKGIYDKPIANITLNGEKLKPFPLKSRTRQGCTLSLLLFNIVLELQGRAIRQEEEIKGIQIDKGTVKISLFADDMILYLKDPKNFTQKLLNTINSYSKVAGYKINLQKSLAVLYTNNEKTEKEYMKTNSFTIASKKSNI
jgi:hypothetical protein